MWQGSGVHPPAMGRETVGEYQLKPTVGPHFSPLLPSLSHLMTGTYQLWLGLVVPTAYEQTLTPERSEFTFHTDHWGLSDIAL